MRKRDSVRARGSILMLALLVVTIGTLVGTSIMYYAGSDRRAAGMGVSRVQARAMAWSGVQAAMAELSKQRDALLAGEAPTITESWTAPALEGQADGGARTGPRWGFRVMPVAEKTLWSEMGKLDVNSAPAELMAKLPGVDDHLASRIVSARERRPFTSVAELLTVSGVTHQLLYGAGSSSAVTTGSETSGGVTPLSRYVTVYSFDPEVQVGKGRNATESAGKQRININVTWSEELGEAIEKRFDKGVADGVKALMERGDTFEKVSSMVAKLREMRVEPEAWVEVLDAFTTNPDQFRMGAVDLLTASEVVLACVPGITPEAAAEIAARREKLDTARRGTAAWPVLENIMTPEEFEKAADYLTSRSLQWRVVVEGGIFEEDEGAEGANERPDWDVSEPVSGMGTRSLSGLRDRVVLEAVIDVSSMRARVAYLREVTFLPTARILAEADEMSREKGSVFEQSTTGEAENIHLDGIESLPDAFNTELNSNQAERGRVDEDEDAAGTSVAGREGSDTDEVDGEGGSARGAGNGAGAGLPVARDRRVGRWTAGSGGSKE